MKLDYATLISPYSFSIKKIGNIKSPTLKEIWNPEITYQKYNIYLSFLSVDIKTYCNQIDVSKSGWYQSLSEEDKLNINMFDLINFDENLQNIFSEIFSFFFEENVIWDNENKLFITFVDYDENGQIIPIGTIYKDIFWELCDVILQRCGINRSDTNIDISKVKNKRALKILNKIKKAKEKLSKTTQNMDEIELPNLISSIAVKSNSLNFINIWNLTVYQLYEQFKKEQTNVYFDIQKMSVAAYGNKENTFKGNEWYKNEN